MSLKRKVIPAILVIAGEEQEVPVEVSYIWTGPDNGNEIQSVRAKIVPPNKCGEEQYITINWMLTEKTMQAICEEIS